MQRMLYPGKRAVNDTPSIENWIHSIGNFPFWQRCDDIVPKVFGRRLQQSIESSVQRICGQVESAAKKYCRSNGNVCSATRLHRTRRKTDAAKCVVDDVHYAATAHLSSGHAAADHQCDGHDVRRCDDRPLGDDYMGPRFPHQIDK